jgi:F-box protein 11
MSNSNSAPIAFMSYVHFDDKHDEGFLTELRKYLSAEVRVQTGAEFHIFQDREDIKWGQFWQERIEDSLSGVTFLILILTPSFFKSEFCRSEVEKFLNRQQNLKHESIILPIYYVNCDVLEKDSLRSNDLLAKQISRYQYVDWRDLRFEPLTSPIVRRRLADLASHIRKALDNISSKVETSNVTVQLEQPPQESNVVSTASALVQQIASHTLPKVEPPTLIVDAKGQGHYVSITSAVKVAQSGYRILVRPGIYREAFLVDKSLEIMGDGQLEEIVVESSKQAPISFNARMGQITNLTIRQTGSAFGVDITQGHLEIYDCDISSRHGMCVVVRGGAANPHIYRNLIHNSRGGVAVFDNGQGIIEDNDIFGHRMACISYVEI